MNGRVDLSSEVVANADGSTPVFVKITAAGTFDVRPEVGGVRQNEIGAEAVFNPGKLFKTPIFERWGKQFCLN